MKKDNGKKSKFDINNIWIPEWRLRTWEIMCLILFMISIALTVYALLEWL